MIPAGRAGELSWASKAFYFATGLGHQAVVVFFVLSGFFISRSVVLANRTGTWDWSRYATNRLSRLWTVLVPALLLTAGWDQLGMRMTDAPIYSGRTDVLLAKGLAPENYGVATFLGNVFFLQSIITPTFGTNGPLWSLANEFSYYVLFPLMFTLAFGGGGVATRVVLATALGLYVAWLPGTIFVGYAIWLMGYAAFVASERESVMRFAFRPFVRWAAGVSFGSILVLSAAIPLTGWISDLSVGIAATALVIALAHARADGVSRYARAAGGIADLSYTLYLVHLPACVFLYAAFLPDRLPEMSVLSYGVFALVFAAVFLYAVVVYRAFEARTDGIRRLAIRLGRSITLPKVVANSSRS